MDELHRKWKGEDQDRRHERRELTRGDWAKMGPLPPQYQEATKNEIRGYIRSVKQQIWAEAMGRKGVKVHRCDCGTLFTDQRPHRCFNTNVDAGAVKGQEAHESRQWLGVVGPRGFSLKTQTAVDDKKLNEMFDRLGAAKNASQAQKDALEQLTLRNERGLRADEAAAGGDTVMRQQ
jgi:hypothetical protein